MHKIVVILYGPPGSGKGTQANLVADKLGLIHFDTGKFLEATVHDPKRQKEKVIRRERKLFDGGMLMTPSFTLREVSRETKKIAGADWGIVYSGSPRTLFEAEGLVPILEKIYSKKNIFVFVLNVPPAVSAERNSKRLLCAVCNTPLLVRYYPSKKPKYCPVCAGHFYKRTLDKPEVIKIRLKQYVDRTKPIFEFMKKRGYKILEVDGRPAPYKVFERVFKYVKSRTK